MKVGDVVKVSAAPASRYHNIDGQPVTIIAITEHDNKPLYVFFHGGQNGTGYGAMLEHGFKR
ncbi:hypothetical protein [Vibrio phage VH7D]|uniref:Uncharacterized protein n=2 Tax=Schizotequatrovirus TaxID=1198137 RepID=A0A126HHD7_9CAUD|nr:hypothetical protein CF80_gp077 [Vibrio phage VH7D]AGB06864.1 hypothetical protein [Vibrio phage VH7D]ALP47312.1 hypothetical protein phiGrn1_0304 [Vibrio phage phi-Grn1]QBX06280.1 hypothetical protein Va3_327 [Vibrio phage Va3]URQ03397.1 hypothetical protein PVA23_20 [Vibrio phage PVA23]